MTNRTKITDARYQVSNILLGVSEVFRTKAEAFKFAQKWADDELTCFLVCDRMKRTQPKVFHSR